MRSALLRWLPAAGLFFAAGISAHHDSGGTSGLAGFTAAGQTGFSGNPVSFLSLQEDWLRSDRAPQPDPVTLGGRTIQPQPPAQSLLVTTVAGEYAFNRFVSAGLQVPVVRVERKSEADFTRVGRVLLGGRASPLRLVLPESAFVSLFGAVGVPSGIDTGVARGGDFWSGHGGLTLGARLKMFGFSLTAEGEWPLSRLEAEEEESALTQVEHILSGEAFELSTPTFSLKKVTRYTAMVSLRPRRWWGVFAGYQYQDRFYGMVEDNRVAAPRIYREAQIGAEVWFGRATFLSAAYRYPLERGDDRKRNEEIYSVALTRIFVRSEPRPIQAGPTEPGDQQKKAQPQP